MVGSSRPLASFVRFSTWSGGFLLVFFVGSGMMVPLGKVYSSFLRPFACLLMRIFRNETCELDSNPPWI